MTDKKSSESRRKLLKSIAAGSGAIVAGKSLPESWKRPVVDSVMLPAHAQTSPPSPPSPTFSCSVVGQASIDVTSGTVAGPIFYVVTNTGTGPLTGGNVNVTRSSTNVTFGSNVIGSIPDPLAPGDSFQISLTNIAIPSTCPTTETITVEFTSNESTCQQVVDVSCT